MKVNHYGIRGGAWGLNQYVACSTFCGRLNPNQKYVNFGFRVMRKENYMRRVLRGGSWLSPPMYLRVAYRSRVRPDDRINNAGFRVLKRLS